MCLRGSRAVKKLKNLCNQVQLSSGLEKTGLRATQIGFFGVRVNWGSRIHGRVGEMKNEKCKTSSSRGLTNQPLALGRLPQTLGGSFSAVSKPNFASKTSFESSRRDLHNTLLCTVLISEIEKPSEKEPVQNNPSKR